MQPIRYIITRNCLQEGSIRLLKYNEGYFPSNGTVQFRDEKDKEYSVQIDRATMRISGLAPLFREHNLGVNDVLVIKQMSPECYQVSMVVKPLSITASSPRPAAPKLPDPPTRVVTASTPHVKEVRLKQASPSSEVVSFGSDVNRAEEAIKPAPVASALSQNWQAANEIASQANHRNKTNDIENQVAELAKLCGYRLEHLGSGLMCLTADLGQQHGYSVLLAADPLAIAQPAWSSEGYENKLILLNEAEKYEGSGRLTREALSALLEHARLTVLSPLDLRGYWRAGNIDSNTVSSISELVSANLAQRGTFSFVLLALSRYSANSIVSMPTLVSALGNGVNRAELSAILETLTRQPFSVLTQLQGGQYLLRTGVSEGLAEISDYAQGVRRRVKTTSEAILVAD